MHLSKTKLSIALVGGVGLTLSVGISASAATFTPEPLFTEIQNYQTTIPANGDLADVYFPVFSESINSNSSLPIALLLQGSNVDKSNYSQFASIVASYGFAVVVPNHPNDVFAPFGIPTGLFSEQSQVNDVLSYVKAENSNPDSPIFSLIDTNKMVLLGHSYGGFAGLYAIEGSCVLPFCLDQFTRPPELLGGAFYGSALSQSNIEGRTPMINNGGLPLGILAGNLDALTPINAIKKTYDQIQQPPKFFVSVTGANHYSITNTNQPFGSVPDPIPATLNQDLAVETIARWSALFLRGYALEDSQALEYVNNIGDELDENVTVISQVKSVPEKSSIWGLFIIVIVSLYKKKISRVSASQKL